MKQHSKVIYKSRCPHHSEVDDPPMASDQHDSEDSVHLSREVLERCPHDSIWMHSANMYFRTASLQRTDLHHVLKVFL